MNHDLLPSLSHAHTHIRARADTHTHTHTHARARAHIPPPTVLRKKKEEEEKAFEARKAAYLEANPAGDGWVSCKDDEGKAYWHNDLTGETMWHEPGFVILLLVLAL